MYLKVSGCNIVFFSEEALEDLNVYADFFQVDSSGRSVKAYSKRFSGYKDVLFSPSHSGHYFAKLYFLDGDIVVRTVETHTVLFVSELDRSLIKEKIYSSDLKCEILPYFESPDPQNDFLLVYESKEKEKLSSEWLLSNRLVDEIDFGESRASLYCRKSSLQNGNFKNTVFSGYSWVNDNFVYGSNQLEERDLAGLNGSLGMFTCCQKESNKFRVFSDYFGFCKLFYYKSEAFSCVSNNYHNLLLFLKFNDKNLEIDFEVITLNFSSNVTLFLQAVSKRMPVKNTFMLNAWEEIILDHKGLNVERSRYYFDQKARAISSKDSYKEFICKVSERIIKNIKAVFENKSFDKLIFDLSGGRDSRVNYSALTRISKQYSNFYIRSNIHEPDDLKVAISINNLYRFPYYSGGETIKHHDFRELIRNKRSYNLGYRFLWYIPTSTKRIDKAIRISGESFEAFSTRYYSNVISNPLKGYGKDELLNTFLLKLSKQSVIDFTENKELLKKLLECSLDDTPDEDPIVGFDNLFLYYRMATHAGNLDREFYDISCCMPLQAKEFLDLKNYWIRRFEPDHIIYDITYSLNSLLSSLPYNNEKTNNNRSAAMPNLLLNDDPISRACFSLDYTAEAWQQAFEANSRNSSIDGVEPNVKEIEEFVYNEIFSYARSILEICPLNLDEFITQILSYVLINRKNAAEVRIVHNKLANLYDLLKISI